MTTKYKNVYISDVSTVVGPYEAKGPLAKKFDKSYSDMYFETDSLESAEVKLMSDSIDLVLKKTSLEKSDIDLMVDSGLKGLSFVGLIESVRMALGEKEIDMFDITHIEKGSLIEREIEQTGVEIYEE